MRICTIHCHLSTTPAVTMTLAGGHKVTTKQPVGFKFLHSFQLNGMKFDMFMKQFKVNVLKLLSSDIYLIEENVCCFTFCKTAIKTFNTDTSSDICKPISFKCGMLIDTT